MPEAQLFHVQGKKMKAIEQWIVAWIELIDAIVCIFTLGFIYPGLAFKVSVKIIESKLKGVK